MMYLDEYESPVGTLSLASDGEHLCGLWLENQKYYQDKLAFRTGQQQADDGNKSAGWRAGEAQTAQQRSGDAQATRQQTDGAQAASRQDDGAQDEQRLSADTQMTYQRSAGILAARDWLDAYFEGKNPGALPPIQLHGTPFQEEVWNCLKEIPYGTLTTYGDIARQIEKKHGDSSSGGGKVSARAVGVAVGRNPVSIIVPCHRVVGANRSLTGYAGGIARKKALLELEGVDASTLKVPTKGTAL